MEPGKDSKGAGMSGSLPAPPGSPPQPGEAADPSMEDILASIRRILSEDEAAAAPAAPASGEPEVLALEPSMLVEEPPLAVPYDPAPVAADPPAPPAVELAVVADPGEPAGAGLVAPAAAAAAASSLGALVRTLAERQSLAVHRGGPTLEDIVREEMRPMLKAWLDKNLPGLVERLVRVEIERVIGRITS